MVHCHLGPTRSGRAGIVRSVSCDQGFVTAHSLHSSCHARPFAHQRLHERQRIVARRRPTGRYEAMNLSLMLYALLYFGFRVRVGPEKTGPGSGRVQFLIGFGSNPRTRDPTGSGRGPKVLPDVKLCFGRGPDLQG